MRDDEGRAGPGHDEIDAEGGRREDAAAARREDQEHLRALQRARQARVAKAVVALALVVLFIVFIIANAKPVPVSFVFATRHPLLIWVMIGTFVAGGIVGYLIGKPGRQVRLHRRDEPGTGERRG